MPTKPLLCVCGDCRVCRKREREREWRKANPLESRARSRANYHRHREQRVAARRAYDQTPEGQRTQRETRAKWERENREKYLAGKAVRCAIAEGRLERQPCEVCGAEPSEGHHDDYSKRLDVRWLCQVHHKAHHRERRAAALKGD